MGLRLVGGDELHQGRDKMLANEGLGGVWGEEMREEKRGEGRREKEKEEEKKLAGVAGRRVQGHTMRRTQETKRHEEQWEILEILQWYMKEGRKGGEGEEEEEKEREEERRSRAGEGRWSRIGPALLAQTCPR